MDYREKLKSTRFRQSTIDGRDFNEEMESDRGRAINSAAVRRLQQKTQVFPFESNSAVRSRLTHSLEVQQVGRYISKLIIKELKDSYPDISNYSEGFVSAVEVACLLHDIGNPPFGHFGEEAINLWTAGFLTEEIKRRFSSEEKCDIYVKDLCNFEGNAQGLRILHQLQSLNLTYTQLACLIKYTRPAFEEKPCKDENKYKYRKKKPGYYFSELEIYKKIKQDLSINSGCRFPLVYIMEAADDISYCIADIDDAIDKGIISYQKVDSEIRKLWANFKGEEGVENSVVDGGYLLKICDAAMEKAQEEKFNKNHVYILTLRTRLVNDLAKYAAKRYIDNHEDVFHGRLDESLLDGSDEFNLATETLRKLAVENVFSSDVVENLELKGYAVIKGLLNIYSGIIKLGFEDFRTLVMENRLKSNPIESMLFHKLSNKHKATYLESVKDIYDKDSINTEDELLEIYYRSRLVIDYVSGMTDGYALDEYQNLSAAK